MCKSFHGFASETFISALINCILLLPDSEATADRHTTVQSENGVKDWSGRFGLCQTTATTHWSVTEPASPCIISVWCSSASCACERDRTCMGACEHVICMLMFLHSDSDYLLVSFCAKPMLEVRLHLNSLRCQNHILSTSSPSPPKNNNNNKIQPPPTTECELYRIILSCSYLI